MRAPEDPRISALQGGEYVNSPEAAEAARAKYDRGVRNFALLFTRWMDLNGRQSKTLRIALRTRHNVPTYPIQPSVLAANPTLTHPAGVAQLSQRG